MNWKPGDPERRRFPILNENDAEIFAEAVAKAVQKADHSERILGLRLRDWVILASVAIVGITFYVRTDDAMRRLIVTTEYLMKFANNSDNYNSAKYGVEFYQGKPTRYNSDSRPSQNFDPKP